jgi:hypothetical protein
MYCYETMEEAKIHKGLQEVRKKKKKKKTTKER